MEVVEVEEVGVGAAAENVEEVARCALHRSGVEGVQTAGTEAKAVVAARGGPLTVADSSSTDNTRLIVVVVSSLPASPPLREHHYNS